MGKLNDHFRDRKTPEMTNPLGKGQVSRLLDCFKDRNSCSPVSEMGWFLAKAEAGIITK